MTAIDIKPIVGTPYGITEDGTVWRLSGSTNWKGQTPPHKVNPVDNGNGYSYVMLSGRSYYIHRLVAEYFIDNPNNLRYVGHKDHNKCNNTSTNLYWTTASGNTKDGIIAGRINNTGRYKDGYNRYDSDTVEEVYMKFLDGMTISELSSMFGINRTTISSWVNKRSHKDITDNLDKK